MALAQPEPQSALDDRVDHALQASEGMFRCVRMQDAEDTDAVAGAVHWMPAKSIWISTMTLVALLAGPPFFSWGALVLLLATTATTVCLGHSLGMHRRLIHRSYDCPLWLERLFVYLGTHAFPCSARLGVRQVEMDPGWWVLSALGRLGLVWNIKTPEMLPHRPNLVSLRQ